MNNTRTNRAYNRCPRFASFSPLPSAQISTIAQHTGLVETPRRQDFIEKIKSARTAVESEEVTSPHNISTQIPLVASEVIVV